MVIVRFFNKENLISAIENAQEQKYERVGCSLDIKTLKSGKRYPIIFQTMHLRIRGKPSALYMRCVVLINKAAETIVLDVDIDTYRSLNYMYHTAAQEEHTLS